ncbi:MAG: hypothetical protein JXA96_12845 [Sedimentisphaerales bacterium]|nr:hypothetical protein [Sedimentisphaerales bacterium]
MNKPDIIRIPFFILFFSIGAASLGLSVLCDDLVKYFRNVQLRESTQKSIEKLKSFNEDYGSLLENIEEDPNFIKRIAPAVSGSEYLDANAAYPKATARELAAARKAFGDPNEENIKPVIPVWLSRSCDPQKRMTLFFSGVALMLISFVCFRPLKTISE